MLPPKSEWTATMNAIAGLVRQPVFRTADVLEFGKLTKETFQMGAKRGVLKHDPAKGSGYPREFQLDEIGALVMGYQIGRLMMGRTTEAAIDLGGKMSDQCIRRWLETACAHDQAVSPKVPAPLTALTVLLLEMADGYPEFLVITSQGEVWPAPPEASLGEVWTTTRAAVFTTLDVRTAMFQHFVPLVFRLIERVEADEADVEKLRKAYRESVKAVMTQAAEIETGGQKKGGSQLGECKSG